jgi:phosphatidylglycerophosphatase C
MPNTVGTVAAFDFDETLTDRDTLLPFLRLVVGNRQYLIKMSRLSPILTAYALRFIPNWRAKQAVLSHFLAGIPQEQLHKAAEHFAEHEIPKWLRHEAVERLRWHQSKGHHTILVSASLAIYLQPWAQHMGIQDVLGTELEVQEGRLTGRIRGKNCYGPEKLARLQRLINVDHCCLYAYGDSKGDRELLSVAQYPYYRTFSTRTGNKVIP